jgi:hypothetical protein
LIAKLTFSADDSLLALWHNRRMARFKFIRRMLILPGVFLFALALSVRAEMGVSVLISTNIGPAIPADFNGLSFEMQRVLAETNGSHFFSATNKALIATFKMLGVKSLRVGGNTADRPTLPTPSEADVDNLFAFAKAADLKIIFTLRLNQGEIDAAVKMANHISRRYQKQLDCFAIGNEPNVFSTNYDVYLTEWKRYAAAITAPSNSPGAKFCGPSVSPGHEKWSARFANDLAGTGLLKFISQHDYPGGDARRNTNAPVARDKILSPTIETHYKKFAANFVPAVVSNELVFRFEEANSFYDGGAVDVSDTFASALWALDYQWWWVGQGMCGINFHTGDKVAARDENKPCRYATFWTSTNGYNIHPIGYAEKIFSLGGRGKILPVTVELVKTIPPQTKADFNLTAYAVLGDDKNIYLTLINRMHDTTATNLNVMLGVKGVEGWSKGQIMRLTAPGGISAKTGMTLGGAGMTDDAKWDGKWESLIVPFQRTQFPIMVQMPAASAAIVKLTPR